MRWREGGGKKIAFQEVAHFHTLAVQFGGKCTFEFLKAHLLNISLLGQPEKISCKLKSIVSIND